MPTFIIKNNATFTAPVVLQPADERHLLRVMRASKGELCCVTNNQGQLATVRIESVRPLQMRVIKVYDAQKPAPITVCLSLIDQRRLEWAVEKLSELNIEAVQLIVAQRSQTRALKPDKMRRLQMTAEEAQKQCGRGWPLRIGAPIPLDELVFDKKTIGIVADTTTGKGGVGDLSLPVQKYRCFIGPEGGYSREELEYLDAQKSLRVSLGATVLRSETAAVVMAGVIKELMKIQSAGVSGG